MNSYKCPYLSGHTVITDSATYSVGNLPEGATVSWSLDAVYSNDIDFFTDNPEANQCKIIRRLMVPYADTLRAVVYLGGEELITLKKAIYAHFSHFYAIYDQMPSAGNTGAHRMITASTGITYIYGDAPVTVFSPNFTGMTITPVTSYSGQYTFSRVDDTSICLSLSSNSVYPLIIRVSSDDGNEAYTLNFNLISGGNFFLSVQSSGSRYELQLMNDGEGKAGSKGMKTSQEGTACWQLEVYQALTGRKVLSRSVTGRTAAFDTPTWDAGVYLINATIGDDKVSKKINVTK